MSVEIEDMVKRFGLFVRPEGSDMEYFEDLDQAMAVATRLNAEEPTCHLWTIVDGDDGMYVSEGSRWVNRMHMWLVTRRPHDFMGNEFVWCLYDEDSEIEE